MVKIIISVSKRHKNNHAGVKNGAWVVYYYDEDWKLQTKRINPLLVQFYKLARYHRIQCQCDECDLLYITFVNWHDKNQDCPRCYPKVEEFDTEEEMYDFS